MSKTKRNDGKGGKVADKSRRKPKDRKFFGFTSGTHSQFEKAKEHYRKEFENTAIDDPWYNLRKKHWDAIKDQAYPVKDKDFTKYGWGGNNRKKNNT